MASLVNQKEKTRKVVTVFLNHGALWRKKPFSWEWLSNIEKKPKVVIVNV